MSVAYLEGEGEDAQLVVVGRSIDIHQDMTNLQQALGYENIRYEEAYSGGQFGQKSAMLSEAITGAAALHFRRPVRYVPSLADSMLTTTKRHAFDMQVKLGCDKDGKLTAFDIDFIVDNGAYMNIGIYVFFRCLWMLSGSYNIPNVNALAPARLHEQSGRRRGPGGGAAPDHLRPRIGHGHACRQGRDGPPGIQADQFPQTRRERLDRTRLRAVALPRALRRDQTRL